MNDEQKPLSDSEIQKLRDDIADTERRRWLYRLIRTGAAWTVGVIAATGATIDAIKKAVDVVTGK
jgi:hypothetical protein